MNDPTRTDKPGTARALLHKLAIAVLAGGLALAAAIFATAPPETEDGVTGTEIAAVGNSKRYQRELERIGGKAAIAAAQFNDWFESLWHGRRLAGTVAAISVAVSLVLQLAAKTRPPPDN